MGLDEFTDAIGGNPLDFEGPAIPLAQARSLLEVLSCAYADAHITEAHRHNYTGKGLPADWPSKVDGIVPDSDLLLMSPKAMCCALEGIATLVALGAFLAQQEGRSNG